MAEDKKIVNIAEGAKTEEKADNGRTIELGKPYKFEGKEYETLDMSGLDKLTIQDAIDIQKQLFAEGEVAAAMVSETTTAFARAVAARATGLPIEFFKLMPRGMSAKVGAAVRNYLNVRNTTKDHYVTFEKPYTFKEKVYEGVDLSGIADLNSMNESEAENRMAREGFVVTETSFNYLYACVLASMGAKLPEEFFTGLPITETLRIKGAANDSSFFE